MTPDLTEWITDEQSGRGSRGSRGPGGPELRQRPRPVGPARHGSRIGRRVDRRHRGRDRTAGHRPRLRRRPGRPAVGGHRLHPDAGRPAPARWRPRRQVRAQAGVHDRRRLVRPGVAALLCRPDGRDAHRRPGAAGCRGRAADAGQPGHPGSGVPPRRPGQGHRRLVRLERRRHRHRPVHRRMAGPGGVLAADLRDQPADRRPRRGRDAAARAGVPGPGRHRAGRRDRRRPGDPGPGRADLRADPGPGQRLGQHPGADLLDRRRASPRRLRLVGAPGAGTHAAAEPVPLHPVHLHQRGHVHHLRRHRRGAVPAAHPAAAGIGLHAAGGRDLTASGHAARGCR